MDKSLAKNAAFNIAYKLLNVLFPLTTIAYVSRILMPEGVGKVSYAQTIASIFVIIASLGVPAYGVKKIAALKNNEDPNEIHRTYSEILVILILSTIVTCCVYSVIIFSLQFTRREINLYLAAGLQILLVSCNVDWLYQGKEDYKYIALRSFALKILSLVLILFLVRTQDDYIIYALITSLAVAGNNIINVIHSRKYVYFTVKGLNLKRHLVPVFVLLLSTLAIELYSKVDTTMLGIMCNESTVGYYTNSVKVINALLVAMTAVTAVFLPRLSLFYKENKKEYNKLVNEGVKILLFLSLPLCIGLIIVSDDFVNVIFGSAFSAASMALRILSPLIIIKGIGDLLNYQVIISAGKEKFFLITNSSAAVLNIILNYLLIPVYQQDGAAIASVISELVVNVGMFIVSSRIVKIRIEKRFVITETISVLLMGIIVLAVNNILINSTIRLLLSVVCGAVVYLAVNLIMKNEMLKFFHKIKLKKL